MARRIAAFDWSATALGPVEAWPQSLKAAVRLMLGSRYPMFIWWGEELINFYNDAYVPVLGNRHPDALGRPAQASWSDIWDVVGPLAARVLRSGDSTWNEEFLLVMERFGYTEETYFTFSYSPAMGDDGRPNGVFCACTEDTSRVLGRRRLRTLRELAAESGGTRSAEDACRVAAAALAGNRHDLPFVLVYLLSEDRQTVQRVASVGIAADAAAAPARWRLDSNDALLKGWSIPAALEHGRPQYVPEIPSGLGRIESAPWPEPVKSAVVLPMTESGSTQAAGFLILGISPRRSFDDDYRGFFELVAGQVATAIAEARAFAAERRRAEALAELDRAKTTFFSNVSHELRTPLSLMLGPLEELMDFPDGAAGAQARQIADVAHRNGLRLLKLVNTLLDFSRMEAGRMQPTFQPTDLATFTADLASNFRSAIERAGLRFVVDCRRLSREIAVDRDFWEKIVFNLLSNALKFTLRGEVRVTLHEERDGVVLDVTDTGAGIPESAKGQLFQRFHRVAGTEGRTHEGTGIGLALVQELVKLHGGNVEVRSELGKGSTFIVTLPWDRARAPEPVEAAPAGVSTALGARPFLSEAALWVPEDVLPGPEPAITAEAEGERQATRAHVLLAEDNADMRKYVTRLLASRYRVTAVADGVAALEALEREMPQLVLSDVMMPRLDGVSLLQAIRARPEWRVLPVILLSARAGEQARIEGVDAGADDYLTKPFSARELIARVNTHLELAQVRRRAAQAVEEREGALRDARRRLDATLDSAEIGTWTWDLATDVLVGDKNVARLFGLAAAESGASLAAYLRAVHPEDRGAFEAALRNAAAAGESFEQDVRIARDGAGWRWLTARGKFQTEPDRQTRSMSGVLIDITARKRAELIVQRSERQIAAIINRSPVGIFLLDDRLRFLQVNPQARPAFEDVPDLLGRGLEEVMHVIWSGEIAADIVRHFRQTLATGEPYFVSGFSEERADRNRKEFYDWEVHRLTLPDGQYGVVCYFIDISSHVAAQRKIRDSAEQLRLALAAAQLGHWTWDSETDVLTLSDRAVQILALPRGNTITWTELKRRMHPGDLAPAHEAVQAAVAKGEDYDIEYRLILPKGGERWVAAKGRVRFAEDGRPVGMLGVVQDVTAEKQADQERAALLLREQEARAEAVALNEAAQLFAAELDLGATVQKATDAGTRLTGAKFGAFVYNVADQDQESYVLYALSGATREAFEKFGLPRNTSVFAPTFRGEGVVRVADITEDSRYGKNAPQRGMPAGHLPVRSYLAVPVISRSGKVLGGMFFGHPEPGVFTLRSERIAVGIATQAAIAMDNASLYQAVRTSAERLNFSLSAVKLGIWTWNPKTDEMTISAQTADIFGFPADARLTRTEMRLRVHGDERVRVRQTAVEAFEQRKDYDIEYRIDHPVRGVRWVAAKGRCILGEGGAVESVIGVVQDITERKHAELQLRIQKEVLEEIVQSTALDAVLEKLTTGVEAIVDRKIIAVVMLVEAESRTLRPVAGPSCPDEWMQVLGQRTLRTEIPGGDSNVGDRGDVPVSVTDIATDPNWAPLREVAVRHGLRVCWSTPIVASDGTVLGTFALYYGDRVTPSAHEIQIVEIATRTAAIAIERKQSEQALREYQTQLEDHAQTLERRVEERTARLRETIGELEAFSYSVSHDMRAPLRAMQGYADAVLTDYGPKLDAAGVHALTRIGKNAERLEMLVRDILSYSKVAKEEIELGPVSLDALVHTLLSQMPHLQPPAARVRIPRPLPIVLGHEAYLSQIFSNLLGNAVKFVTPGRTPEIEIAFTDAGTHVKIMISDNGIGIDPAHYERIFQIFGRIYADKKFEGTGIGLSIVKKAVQRIGGTVGVDSKLGEGSCFWFTLRKK